MKISGAQTGASAAHSAGAVLRHARFGVSHGRLACVATQGKAGAGEAASCGPDELLNARRSPAASSVAAGLTPVVTARLDRAPV